MNIAFALIVFAISGAATSGVVGYEEQSLPTNALVRVTPNFAPLGTFPTMKDVIRFVPPESFVGCKLLVDLDGTHWEYDVLSYTADESDYKLSALRKGCRYNSALDGIPALKSFCIRTKESSPLSISTAGRVSGRYAEIIYGTGSGTGSASTPTPVKPFKIEIQSKDGKRWLPLKVESSGLSVRDAAQP